MQMWIDAQLAVAAAVIPKLQSNNYPSWSTAVKQKLMIYRLWPIVDGTYLNPTTSVEDVFSLVKSKPEDSSDSKESKKSTKTSKVDPYMDSAAWDSLNAVALQFIRSTLSEAKLKLVQDSTDSASVWTKLASSYFDGSLTSKGELFNSLFSYSWDPKRTLEDNIADLDNRWNRVLALPASDKDPHWVYR
ncbi:hypothetical protein HK102_006385, partial [Quaeritorhiza haematococci]